MTLAAYQEALAHRVMRPRAGAPAGLAATAAVRRSWCEARSAKAARLTLSVIPAALRAELIAAWVDAGHGGGAFHAREAEAFLAFIATRLPDPSHELTACRLEAALARATCAGVLGRPARAAPAAGALFQRAEGASLVAFTAEPEALLRALLGAGPTPPLDAAPHPLLVAPWIAARARPASEAEVALWERLATPGQIDQAAERATAARLIAEGVLREARTPNAFD